jgi:hypothetical protein
VPLIEAVIDIEVRWPMRPSRTREAVNASQKALTVKPAAALEMPRPSVNRVKAHWPVPTSTPV